MLRFATILGLLSLAACDRPVDHSVRYQIAGSATKASVTMANAQGGTENTRVTVPWRRTMHVPTDGFLYLAAQNEGGGDTITCAIEVDGKPFMTSTSDGRSSIADCSGRVEGGNDMTIWFGNLWTGIKAGFKRS